MIEVERNDTTALAGGAPVPLPSQNLPGELDIDELPSRKLGKFASLSTPAVRHLIKELKLKVEDIKGTGKDGRVTKEDVQKHAERMRPAPSVSVPESPLPVSVPQQHKDKVRSLTAVQSGMFKQMTRSLSIPHFLYTDTVDLTALNTLRKRFNQTRSKEQRISLLPFIVKAVSMSLQQYPILNSHLDTSKEKPHIIYKSQHNIGVAVDSPSGLLVPVVQNVQAHSIESLAAEISRLGALARAGKVTSADMSGATFTVSNIGSLGGTAVAPVVVSPQVGILAVGRTRPVPAFGEDGEIVRKEECVFSWSADHRIIDGATAARCAESVRGLLENIESLLIKLR